jgi:tRNA-specific 2-thiouridylase
MNAGDSPGIKSLADGHNPKRVVVAMSGGVDSSVAAALLVEQGYEVIGMMMRLWSEPVAAQHGRLNRCCTPDQMADARRVAQHLNIPFYVIDAQQYFYDSVVRYFIDQHLEGRTPNPCIQCNRRLRFSYLLDRALALGASYLATGHYARIDKKNGEYELWQAIDERKDQSYVLHILDQLQLATVLFPVGDYTKDNVRQLAQRFDLPLAADKSESMDLCFLADGDYRRFLHDEASDSIVPGPIVNSAGQVLGHHQGLTDYTIGQRKGLGLAMGEPIYVLAKDRASNALIVGPSEALDQSHLRVKNINWISGSPPAANVMEVKIRYRAPAVPAQMELQGSDRALVRFVEPVKGATPGQGAVFYAGQRCLGGGIICAEGWK